MSEDEIRNIKEQYLKINIPISLEGIVQDAISKGKESCDSSRKPQIEETTHEEDVSIY